MRFSRALLTAAIWLAASRLVIGAIGIVGVATFADQHEVQRLAGGESATSGSSPDLTVSGRAALNPERVWRKWDVLWYEQIARHGYGYRLDAPQGQAAAGFFPLYPLTLRLALRALPSVSFFWLGVVFSNLLTLASLTLLLHSLAGQTDRAQRVLLLLVTAAGSFYLSIPYTESLFLLLIVLAMIATRREHYLLAALFCGLAAITRVHGFASIAIPVLACLLDSRLSLSSRVARLPLLLLVFAVPIGLYMAYLAIVQGAAYAFVQRQALWDNAFPYPLKALVGFRDYPLRLSNWLHGAYWGLYVWLLARNWRRMPLGEALFCAGALLISTQQETFHGIYRYTMPLVPLTLALADDDEKVRQTTIAINLVFGVIMILAFVTNNRLTV